MNKILLLKMYLRRGDKALVRQVVYQLSGRRPVGFIVEEAPGGILKDHVVGLKSNNGDEFVITDSSEIGESYNGRPVLSSKDLHRIGELCYE